MRRLAYIERPALIARLGQTRQHCLDLDGDAVALDHDCAFGDRKIVGQDLHIVALDGIELDIAPRPSRSTW